MHETSCHFLAGAPPQQERVPKGALSTVPVHFRWALKKLNPQNMLHIMPLCHVRVEESKEKGRLVHGAEVELFLVLFQVYNAVVVLAMSDQGSSMFCCC